MGIGAVLLAYTAVFASAAWPWLLAAGDSVPHTAFGNRADERLIAYILAWVAHALGTAPSDLFGMPINYPAPEQLAGSEHLLSSQLLFAPAYLLTGNPVLAANVATFALYPLGAAAMYWLAVRIGCDPLVAFAAGLALVLGPGQVPAHLHLLQYPVLFLPLVAGMITSLRAELAVRRAVALGLVAALAFFSSYYMCVLTLLVAALWTLAEVCRPRAGRLRFVAVVTACIGVAGVLLAAFSRPYFARPEMVHVTRSTDAASTAASLLLAGAYAGTSGVLLRCLALLGLAGLFGGAPGARSAARRGLACAAVAGVLMLGPALPVQGIAVPLPYAAFDESPLRFFRYPHRFVYVLAFGRALLVAGGLQAVRNVLPARSGTLLVLAAAAAIATTRAPLIGAHPWDTIAAVRQSVYEQVGRTAAAAGGGPLLELPMIDAAMGQYWTDADAALGQTRHWLPLVGGHTGYQPPHRPLVEQLAARLPAPEAIETLVDVTHVRWLLLRPIERWPPLLQRQRTAIARASWAVPALSLDGWDLLRITPQPSHEDFFTAIKRGWRPGETALGTPAAAVPVAEARASVAGRAPKTVPRARAAAFDLVITNDGEATWPVTVPTFGKSFEPPYAGEVFVRATWHPVEQAGAASDAASFDIELPRDVRPGESLAYRPLVPTPPSPGVYDLELAVRQRNGEAFTPPASRSLHARVEVR